MYWPIGYLIRDVCSKSMSISKMKLTLTRSYLAAPCYITICYVNSTPEVITRDQTKFSITTGEYIVQTNCDQTKEEPDILYSVKRRSLCSNVIGKNENNFLSVEDLVEKVLKYPVLNHETVYYTIMVPGSDIHCSKVTFF